jgi:hypothetical protein
MHAVVIDEPYVRVSKATPQNGECEIRTDVLIKHVTIPGMYIMLKY